jgi:hypothetical protein
MNFFLNLNDFLFFNRNLDDLLYWNLYDFFGREFFILASLRKKRLCLFPLQRINKLLNNFLNFNYLFNFYDSLNWDFDNFLNLNNSWFESLAF